MSGVTRNVLLELDDESARDVARLGVRESVELAGRDESGGSQGREDSGDLHDVLVFVRMRKRAVRGEVRMEVRSEERR